MIEKLPENKDKVFKTETGEYLTIPELSIPKTVSDKINELVDAVNSLQTANTHIQNDLHEMRHSKTKIRAENVQNKFAEQRKWIGCICRFWFDNPDDTVLDYLGKIQTGENGLEYYGKETYDWFPHCEPILPTDKAIYKGGKDE